MTQKDRELVETALIQANRLEVTGSAPQYSVADTLRALLEVIERQDVELLVWKAAMEVVVNGASRNIHILKRAFEERGQSTQLEERYQYWLNKIRTEAMSVEGVKVD
jgi:hypothetical protein